MRKVLTVIFAVIIALVAASYVEKLFTPNRGSSTATVTEQTDTGAGVTGVEPAAQVDTGTGVTGVEPTKNAPDSDISHYTYTIVDGGVVKLNRYDGTASSIEIRATYTIDGVTYTTDTADFQIHANVDAVIFDEGITEIKTAVFNGCGATSIYFPSTITNVYDYSLAYLQSSLSDGEHVKIYYGGTQEQWGSIFTEYQRTKVADAETPEEKGQAAADKLNEMLGSEYDSSLFEYHFSSSPDVLK